VRNTIRTIKRSDTPGKKRGHTGLQSSWKERKWRHRRKELGEEAQDQKNKIAERGQFNFREEKEKPDEALIGREKTNLKQVRLNKWMGPGGNKKENRSEGKK